MVYAGVELICEGVIDMTSDTAIREKIKAAVEEHDELQHGGDGTCHIMTFENGVPTFSDFSGGYMEEIRDEVANEERK